MTPEARVAAAIDILDAWLDGARADVALKSWGRAHRFAGSGDRAAIRDHVFEVIRCRRSFAALGGAGETPTGRALMIGAIRATGRDPAELFGKGPHGPPELGPGEAPEPGGLPDDVRLDCPGWLWPGLAADLGRDAETFLSRSQSRAPVFLRVNLARTDREEVARSLRAEGIETRRHEVVESALEVVANPRRVSASAAFREGLIELQDAHSQAVVSDLTSEGPVLDFCAGGGGKSLAMAALGLKVHACDKLSHRMSGLPERAKRAGANVVCLTFGKLRNPESYDLVLADAPCSGSGTWRRDPEGKWALTSASLEDITMTQDAVLQSAAHHVGPGGRLAYVTCSVLTKENEERIEAFLQKTPGWDLAETRRWSVGSDGDGFFRAIVRRTAHNPRLRP